MSPPSVHSTRCRIVATSLPDMGRLKKKPPQHRQHGQRVERSRGPSNGVLMTASNYDGCDEEGDEAILQTPVVIHENVSLVTLRRTSSSKQERRMGSGTRTRHVNNEINVKCSSVASRHSQSSCSVDGFQREPTVLQRSHCSDQMLSATLRPTSCSHPRSVRLPTLSSSVPNCHKPVKPCRKNLHSTSQKAPGTNPSTRSKLKNTSDTKQGHKSSSKSSPKPRVPILAAITPDNVEREKQRFFDSNYKYDPQFTYRSPPSTSALERYGKATDKLIKLAIQVLRATLQRFKTYKRFEASTGGRPISVSQFTVMFQQYLAQEDLTNKVSLNLSDSLVARALMTRMNGRSTLNARPNALKSQWSDGLLRHEIGTHYIRSANNREHPWASPKGRRQHHLGSVNPTEEGIASIHSVLLRKDPYLWRSAMLYYTTYMASRLSLADLFQDLGAYIEDPEVRWDYCLRAKRGQVDTSKPGCFNKDQVYLEGAFRVLRYRWDIDFHSLYKLGKVALEDVDRLKTLVDLDSPNLKIPTFMADIDEYRKRLDYVVKKNGLDDAELAVLFPGEAPCGKSARQDCSEAQQEPVNGSSGDELVE